MSKFFRVMKKGTYDAGISSWVIKYWAINQHVIIRSPIPFNAGDAVELVDIVGERVDVMPVSPTSDKNINAPRLVILTSPIPVGDDQEYIFSSDKADIIMTHVVTVRGNRNFIILATIAPGTKEATVIGTEKKSNSQLKFMITEEA